MPVLADTAAACNFTKPFLHEGDEFVATDSRHPIVERHVGGAFVPNDVALDGRRAQVVILTGPNMGGKSTYLRQVALLALLAQAGSFVPAKTAKLMVIDRLFARVGASDNIARGQSTFMVEMQETAAILHAATDREPEGGVVRIARQNQRRIARVKVKNVANLWCSADLMGRSAHRAPYMRRGQSDWSGA